LEAGDSNDTLIVRAAGNEHRIALGHGQWARGRSNLASDMNLRQVDAGEQPICASGAWEKSNLYVAKICFVESPVTLNLRLRFGDDFVVMDVDQNVAFGPTTRPTVVGEPRE
jgi:hypothetical protein